MISVLVAGAGPAGSHLSIILANNGINVTLVDRLKSADINSFSSAAIPIEAINKHGIDQDSVSSYWNSWQIFGPNLNKYTWQAKENLGAILDFSKLRNNLWKRARNAGVRVFLGTTVKYVKSNDQYVDVSLSGNDGLNYKLCVDWIVDATGSSRTFIGKPDEKLMSKKDLLVNGFGCEWILDCDSSISSRWANRLSFCIGTSYIKNGYGWLFPMKDNKLKVGVCHLLDNQKSNSLIYKNLNKIITLFKLNNQQVISRNGGFLRSTIRRSEPFINRRIIGVGDSISMANLLGGEGIRHAFCSAEILADLFIKLNRYSNGVYQDDMKVISEYKASIFKKLTFRSIISNKIGYNTWSNLNTEKSDLKLTKLLSILSKHHSADNLNTIMFDYKFGSFAFRLLPYLIGIR